MLVETLKFLCCAAILIFSLVIHEIAHARCAYYLGDPTAKNMGRFSFNPLMHISLLGVLMPIGLYLIGAPMFGFAKPVQYNPAYFKYPRRDMILVGLSGPFSNLILAMIAFGILFSFQVSHTGYMHEILANILIINLMLCFFNLIPIPPLDGSIVYMSSVIKKNPWLASQFIYYGTGLLASLIILMPLIGGMYEQDYNLISLYLNWCMKMVFSILNRAL